jgi:hypothetical protein
MTCSVVNRFLGITPSLLTPDNVAVSLPKAGAVSGGWAQLLSYVDDVELNKELEQRERFYNMARPHEASRGKAPMK